MLFRGYYSQMQEMVSESTNPNEKDGPIQWNIIELAPTLLYLAHHE